MGRLHWKESRTNIMPVKKQKPTVKTHKVKEISSDVRSDVSYPVKRKPRHSAFLPAVVDGILKDIRLGLSLSDSAKRHRLNPDVVRHWYDDNFGNFKEAVEREKSQHKYFHVARVTKADDPNGWRASSWLLERRYKEEYGKEPVNVINIQEMNLIQHQLLQILSNRLANVAPEVIELVANDINQIKFLNHHEGNDATKEIS